MKKHVKGISLFLVLFVAPLLSRAAQPNIVFILADDLGWSDTTLYGKTKFYKTPNIQKLAQRGLTFTNAYSASPLCSPTRSAILTGLSPARTGIIGAACHLPEVILKSALPKTAARNLAYIQPSQVTRLNTNYATLAKSLKAAGYATGHFGKWHLGPEPYSPLEHGFDVDIPHWPGPGPAGSFIAPWKFKNFDPDPNIPNQHLEDRMALEAVKWIEQNKDRPFFLNYWMFSVHAPFDAKKDLVEKYRKNIDPKDPQRSPTYAAMIESMDDAVGKLMDTLDRLGIRENTIVIFTSDNGGNMYDEIDQTKPTSNAPLRGGKATMFEGGTRVPCVIDWPGQTKPGTLTNAVIQSEDFYPTILKALQIKPNPSQIFDGIDISPAFDEKPLTRDAIFQYFPQSPRVPDWLPPAASVHQGDWKLIRLFNASKESTHRYLLFNLKNDLGEKTDLAPQNPAKVKELDALIENFLTRTQAVVPAANPNFNPLTYKPELEGVPRSHDKNIKHGNKPAPKKRPQPKK